MVNYIIENEMLHVRDMSVSHDVNFEFGFGYT
jgi:hypothetical protein